MQLEVPQCPVCTNAITATTKAVASSYCGHVICSDCAAICFPPKRSGSCPVCRTTAASESLMKLYIGFGEHEPGDLDLPPLSNEDGEQETHKSEPRSSQMSLPRLSKARKIVSSLRNFVQDAISAFAANTCPEGSLAFVQAGGLLHRIADSTTDDNERDILHDMGNVLMNVPNLYEKLSDLLKQNKRLEDQLQEADVSKRTNLSDSKEAAKRHQLKYNTLLSDKEEREKELIQRIQAAKEDCRKESELRVRAESRVADLENQVAGLEKKRMRDHKRLIALKQGRDSSRSGGPSTSKPREQRRDPSPGSDSSLQVEASHHSVHAIDDEDINSDDEECPPSSAPMPSTLESISVPSQSSTVSSNSQPQGTKRTKFKAQRSTIDEVPSRYDDDDDILNAPAPSPLKKAKPPLSKGQKPPSIRSTNVIPRMPVPSRSERGRDPLQGSPKKKARLFVLDEFT